MAGKVESFLKSELEKKNALLFVLIDSEVSNLEASSKLAQDVEKIGASAILVGGSSATDQIEMSQVVKGIKQNIQIYLPPLSYTMDNAAMIGAVGQFSLLNGVSDSIGSSADARLISDRWIVKESNTI